MKSQRFIPESKLVIDTIVEDWFDRFNRDLCGTKQVEDLKESLWENLKRFKDI